MRFKSKTDGFLWAAVAAVLLIYLGVGLLMYLPNKDASAFFGLAMVWLFLALFRRPFTMPKRGFQEKNILRYIQQIRTVQWLVCRLENEHGLELSDPALQQLR